jgi:type I restriction enzyme S subunit
VKSGWQKLPFDEVVADESGGNLKTPQSEFLDEGEFAVVDQGKELVSGYVNDRTRLCRSPLPVVVFGDHTRCVKFVDFPFCMGADGIKVLRPKVEADVKYLYHYLRQLRLYDGGYDRHFKYLKRAEVVLPPLPEQRRIADVLDRAEALRAKRRAALAQLDSLIQSLFLDLFGDPATNPKGWPKNKLGDIADKITDGEHQTPQRTTHGIKLLSARNIRDGFIDVADVDYVSPEEHERIKRRCNPEPGDVLISCSGTIGRVATVTTSEPFSLVRSVALIKPKKDVIDSTFLEYHLRTPALHAKMQRSANASSQANLFQGQIRELPTTLPPLPLQREFARRVQAVEKLKTAQRASLGELDALFATLQHRAFRGEL